jgi:hypothetical protein
MRNYLSYGGGVNSTALLLLLHEQGIEHEAVYINHGCDWPETYEYVSMIAEKYPITILTPKIEGFTNLYEYLFAKGKIPMRFPRWCTQDWKSNPLMKYYQTPAFVHIGYAYDERQRAKIHSEKGIEYRFKLIEDEITRKGCVNIIKNHGLSVPTKSGCWFCPFQPVKEYKQLRRKHPELFCKVVKLEERHYEVAWDRYMRCDATTILHKPISKVIDNKDQKYLFEEMEYPPCQCGL